MLIGLVITPPRGGTVARPKLKEDWIPITARISADSARRLRVFAARKGIPTGRILDQLVQECIPPDQGPSQSLRVLRTSPGKQELTIAALTSELEDLGLSQSQLAKLLGLSQTSVNGWFRRGNIPPQRRSEVRRALVTYRERKAGVSARAATKSR